MKQKFYISLWKNIFSISHFFGTFFKKFKDFFGCKFQIGAKKTGKTFRELLIEIHKKKTDVQNQLPPSLLSPPMPIPPIPLPKRLPTFPFTAFVTLPMLMLPSSSPSLSSTGMCFEDLLAATETAPSSSSPSPYLKKLILRLFLSLSYLSS